MPLLQNLQRNSLKDHLHCIHCVILSAAESWRHVPSSPPPADHHRPPRLNRQHVPENDSTTQHFSKTPSARRFQLCTNMLGKGQHWFFALVPLCMTFSFGVQVTKSHPKLNQRKANPCSCQLFQLGGKWYKNTLSCSFCTLFTSLHRQLHNHYVSLMNTHYYGCLFLQPNYFSKKFQKTQSD